MKAGNRGLAALTITTLSLASCKNSSQQNAPQPNTQNQYPQNGYVNTSANQPPLIGAVNAATVTPGQYLAGVLTADDPDRAQGDYIARIEFTTSPEVSGLTGVQIPVATGDRHNYSVLIPASPGMPSTVGTFVVYDSRGASSRTSFPITFQGSNGFTLPTTGSSTNTAAYCAALSEALKLNGILGVALPVICTVFGPKL